MTDLSHFKKSLTSKNRLALTLVIFVMALNFAFGIYNIQKAAFVDEPLWLYNRIPKFWQNITEKDWNGTRRSDKPGVTLMAVSGIGLLKINNPAEYKEDSPEKMESLYFAFRLPILIFTVLMIPLFYFFLRKLLGESISLISTAFIGLSPILVGMNKIINPDSFLWIFSTLSIITYLIYIKNTGRKYLYLSGFFLGLSLLTKYTANILYIFFFGIIFLEYIINYKKYFKETATRYFKKSFYSFLILAATSLLTFATLYPAVWVKPSRLLKGTLFSQAFESIWATLNKVLLYFWAGAPFFLRFLWPCFIFILATGITITISIYLAKTKKKELFAKFIFLIFSSLAIIIFINTYFDLFLFDFRKILASPKSAHSNYSQIKIMLADFYPLLFGISPLVLLPTIYLSVKSVFKKSRLSDTQRSVALYIIIFILLYYSASTFGQVASTIRYQMMLYPLVFILGAMAIKEIANCLNKFALSKYVITFSLAILLSGALYFSTPFYMSYSSPLLPKKYHIDQKDMGAGAYETARYLNSLPNSKELTIWSDKIGVCGFFGGKCYANLDFKKLEKINFDYYVISAGRQAKTTGFIATRIRSNYSHLLRFDRLYQTDDFEWQLEILGRPSNFVRIIKADKVDVSYKAR